MAEPLTEYSDKKLRQEAKRIAETVSYSLNDVMNEQRFRNQKRTGICLVAIAVIAIIVPTAFEALSLAFGWQSQCC
ncbi:MAG: hypothetical protein F4Y67_01115 [Chloroflexi bacterium]|nr:hypothetical protein [Chloroflexota bacterium]